MRVVFDTCAILALLIGLGSCAFSKTTFQETTSAIAVLIGTVFLVGGALLHAAEKMMEELRQLREKADLADQRYQRTNQLLEWIGTKPPVIEETEAAETEVTSSNFP